MLSVLIPTYNYDCTALVHQLAREAAGLSTETEIIVADDCSTLEQVRQAHASLRQVDGCKVFMREVNCGRAATRNFLASQAKGEHLVFLDADGMPATDRFLSLYAEVAGKADVVCGSIVHPSQCPSPDKTLRYKYEKEAETRFTAPMRNRNPYASFRSFNFMISKEAFMKIQFDEDFKDYGYEDLLFGCQLKERGLTILHIENPMLNMDIEDNAVFLSKIKESNRTLKKFYTKLREGSALIRGYELLRRFHLQTFAAWLYEKSEKRLTAHLLGANPSLTVFKCYKLLHFAQLMSQG